MAVTPQNTTGTLFVDYSWNGGKRSFQLHQRTGGNAFSIATVAQQFLEELQPAMPPSWKILGTRFRAAGTNISLPASTINIPLGTSGEPLDKEDPRFVSFIGRSSTGKRTRVSIYGLNLTLEGDYRMENGDITLLDAARAVLAVSNTVVGAVDGSNIAWYNYYNWGYNAYHQRQQRKQ